MITPQDFYALLNSDAQFRSQLPWRGFSFAAMAAEPPMPAPTIMPAMPSFDTTPMPSFSAPSMPTQPPPQAPQQQHPVGWAVWASNADSWGGNPFQYSSGVPWGSSYQGIPGVNSVTPFRR